MLLRSFKHYKSVAISAFVLVSMAACAEMNSMVSGSFEDKISEFENFHSISRWPSEIQCNPTTRKSSQTEGFVLEVYASERSVAVVYGDSLRVAKLHCHAKIRYRLLNWPINLDSGYYVVAARREETAKTLRVLGVFAATAVDILEFADYLDKMSN